jgi:transposase-like protein
MRWPTGALGCVHCGEVGRISKITHEKKGKNQRTRIYQCLACQKQFSVQPRKPRKGYPRPKKASRSLCWA